MRNAFVIAGREFRTFFQTPIGYVILLIFTGWAGWYFFLQYGFLKQQEATLRPLFGVMPIIFLFYAPAITMRLWAEEKKVGTFEVLMTMPIKERDIALGKFIAALGLVVVYVLCWLPILGVVAWLGDPDPGPVWGGMVGAVLMGAAYVAIGLAMSATTENQIIALILSVTACFVFYLLGVESFTAVFPEALGSFLHNASLGNHFQSIARGVIDTRDILYYVTFVAFFLYLNVWFIRRAKAHPVNIALVAGILIMVNIVGGVRFARLDLTEDQRYTLSDSTKNVLGQLDDDLRLTAYLSSDLPAQYSNVRRDIEDTIREFESYAEGRLKPEIVDPSKSAEARAQAEEAGIPELPLQAADADSIEVRKAFMGITLEYRDKEAVQEVALNTSDLEYQLILRIDKITRSEEVKVAFQVNDPFGGMQMPGMQQPPGMRDRHGPQQDMRYLSQLIQTQYETDTVDLKSEVPRQVKTIIVANGDKLSDKQKYHLDQYVMRGGNLIILAEGNDVNTPMQAQMPQNEFMRAPAVNAADDLLSHWGIRVGKNLVMDQSCLETNVPIGRTKSGFTIVEPRKVPTYVYAQAAADHPVMQGIRRVLLPYPASLELSPKPGVEKVELLRTSDTARVLEESFMMVGFETFAEGGANDPAQFDNQYLIAGLVEGEFQSFYTAREIPESVVSKDEEAADSEAETGLPPGIDLESLGLNEDVLRGATEAEDPATASEEDADSSADEAVGEGASADRDQLERDVPGGGVVFQDDPLPVQADPVQANPVQADPVQADPVQADPVQANPVQADPVQAEPAEVGEAEESALDEEEIRADLEFRGKSPPNTRILAVSDIEFAIDAVAQQWDDNALFLFNAVNFLSSKNDLSGVRAKRQNNRPFEEPSDAQKRVALIVGVVLMPIVFLVMLALVYAWRRVWRPNRARRMMAAAGTGN